MPRSAPHAPVVPTCVPSPPALPLAITLTLTLALARFAFTLSFAAG